MLLLLIRPVRQEDWDDRGRLLGSLLLLFHLSHPLDEHVLQFSLRHRCSVDDLRLLARVTTRLIKLEKIPG